MDRRDLAAITHRWHPIAAPVAPERLRTLVHRLGTRGGQAADLGCGHGEWLMALLETDERLSGVGVDLSLPVDLASAAAARGLAHRVRWVEADAAGWQSADAEGNGFDAVLCVGATHAFGGLDGTLAAIRRLLRPGGRALLGDAVWDAPPTPAALAALDAGRDEFPDLAGLVDSVRAAGFEPGYGHVSTLQEWDDYEFSWTGALTEWALHEAAGDAERAEALDVARSHRDAWLRGYRGQLGFVTLVLHDVGTG